MKATIIAIREGAFATPQRHTVVVTFSEKQEELPTNLLAMMSGIIAGGVNHYEATFDLVRIFAALPKAAQDEVTENGLYVPEKGFKAASETLFKVGTEIDNENFNLFVIPILEVSGGRCASVSVQKGTETRTMSAYRKAGFFDRETCLSICKSAYAANVKNGTFVENLPISQQTAPQQTAPQAPNLASLLSGANAPQ